MKAKVIAITDGSKSLGLVSKHGVLWLPKFSTATNAAMYSWRTLKIAFPHKLKGPAPHYIDLNDFVGCYMNVHTEIVMTSDCCRSSRLIAGDN